LYSALLSAAHLEGAQNISTQPLYNTDQKLPIDISHSQTTKLKTVKQDNTSFCIFVLLCVYCSCCILA